MNRMKTVLPLLAAALLSTGLRCHASTIAVNSATEKTRDGIVVETGPPVPGVPDRSDWSSWGFSPATLARRSPKPSRRSIRACSSPSRNAIAFRCPWTRSCARSAASR